MKKNFLIAAASAALLLGSDLAIAADVSFSGQIRPRMETRDHDFNSTSDDQTYMGTRVRLNAKATANENTSVFLQFQSVGVWGFSDTDSQGSRTATGGGGNQALDTLNDVGLHQAYFTLKNLYNTGVTAKVGRQEVVLDGHRLYGHTGWTHGAQTQDAARFTHAGGNHTLSYIFIKGVEDASGADFGASGNNNTGNNGSSDHDENDYNTHIFHANTQGIMGGDLSGYVIFTDDNNTGAQSDPAVELAGIGQEWWTIGARQKGKAGGLDYRVEYYHQFGEAGATANAGLAALYTNEALSGDVDRDAYMFGMRVGKTFKNSKYSPTITLWYDHLSGTDDGDGVNNEMATFDTHHDTGHKFYGFMDHYLARDGGRTEYLGLRDFAVKGKFKLSPGWILKADMHWFSTDTDYGDNATIATTTAYATVDTSLGKDLGEELDLTLVHKYASNVKLVYGYSHYWNSNLFAALNGTHNGDGAGAASTSDSGDSDWAYIMADVKF